MKKVLILAIGCQLDKWSKMADTSCETWDSIEVPNVETVFYFGNPIKENTDKFIYFNVEESYYTMIDKMVLAFEWALKNKKFDYIARINSSTYVDKKLLAEYIQTLSDINLFSGVEVDATPKWMVGWTFLMSRDIIQLIVDNKKLLRHDITDDLALSYLMNDLKVPYTKGKIASIDKVDLLWRLTGYGSESFMFHDFKDCNKSRQHFYRVKQDYNRQMDGFLMVKLFNNLNLW